MSVSWASRRLQPGSGADRIAIVLLLALTLSAGAAVHNHGLFAIDDGAEKVSQSKFTCPACVFDGKPIVAAEATVVASDSDTHICIDESEESFDRFLEETPRTRAPPAA